MRVNSGVSANNYTRIKPNPKVSYPKTAAQRTSAEIWSELRQSFNVRKSTFSEMASVAQKLYDSGEISLMSLGIMTIRMPTAIDGKQVDPFSTPADGMGRRDWISEFEHRMKVNMRGADAASMANAQKVMDILHRLER